MKVSKASKLLMCLLAGLICATRLQAGPPPGAPGYAPGTPSQAKVSSKTGIVFDIGFYSPSLKMVREDLEHFGYLPMKNGVVYNVGISTHNTGVVSQHTFSHWSGTSKQPNFVEKMDFYMYHANVYFTITGLSKLISPQENLKPEIGVMIRDVIAVMQDKYPLTDQYLTTFGLTMDLGPSLRFEYFLPVEPVKNIAFSATLDWVALSLPLVKLDIFDTNIPGIDVSDDYVNHNGEKFSVQTSGLILKFGLGIYF